MQHPIAVYAGSFDPPTLGHLDLMERAAKLFERVIIAVGRHPTRNPLFTFDERLALLTEVTKGIPNLTVDSFEGLLYQYCEKVGARVIVLDDCGHSPHKDQPARLVEEVARFFQEPRAQPRTGSSNDRHPPPR